MEELVNLTPLYNKEFYLAYLCGEDVALPIPDGNAEHYLAYLCGMDVEIPDVPDGNNAHYLAYKCGQDVELPDPLYRIEFYLAKWCGMDVEVPEPMYRIEYWLAQLANSGELKTVTGNPISISDALAKPAEALTIEILPSQDLNGYANPWPAGGGVNIFDKDSATVGKWLNVSTGAEEATSNSYALTDWIPVKANTAYSFTNPSSSRRWFYDTNQDPVEAISSNPYAPSVDGFIRITISVASVDIDTFMVVKGNALPDTYSPYSNICQITGRTGVNIPRTGKNMLDPLAKTNISAKQDRWYVGTGFLLKGGQAYTLSNTDGSNAAVYFKNVNSTEIIAWGTNTCTYTPTDDILVSFQLYDNTSTQGVDVQLELGSHATDYEPFVGTTYSISWQDEAGTVYGCTLNPVSGVMTVNMVGVDMGSLNWSETAKEDYQDFRSSGVSASIKIVNSKTKPNMLCSMFTTLSREDQELGATNAIGISSSGNVIVYVPLNSYADKNAFKAAMSGVQLVYELATPLVIQLTPTEVQMLLGNNVLWNDVDGDMTLEYLADGPADDVDALQILLGNRYVNNGAEDEATDREALDILLGGNTR